MNENYYVVTAVCGHVGKGRGIDKDFAVRAFNGKEAARIARDLPRVKHDMKGAIKNVVEVDFERFERQILINDNDPFLRCRNRQEQNLLCPQLDFYTIEKEEKRKKQKVSEKRYFNNYCYHSDSMRGDKYYEVV